MSHPLNSCSFSLCLALTWPSGVTVCAAEERRAPHARRREKSTTRTIVRTAKFGVLVLSHPAAASNRLAAARTCRPLWVLQKRATSSTGLPQAGCVLQPSNSRSPRLFSSRFTAACLRLLRGEGCCTGAGGGTAPAGGQRGRACAALLALSSSSCGTAWAHAAGSRGRELCAPPLRPNCPARISNSESENEWLSHTRKPPSRPPRHWPGELAREAQTASINFRSQVRRATGDG
jgi:hypothetical protein